ncbi:MAG: hypothetical protein LBR89_02845 [Holosporales bacterium]|nr:hypothetical protein [Holosporales bacterium]
MRLLKLSILAFLCASTGAPHLLAKPPAPLPRIACLKSSKANLHVGPGLEYPVDWVLTLKHMPVIIISEFGQWRRIKLFDETIGWVHKSLLSTKLTAMIKQETNLRTSKSERANKIAVLGKHVVVSVLKRNGAWTRVVVTTPCGDKVTGWVGSHELWGNTSQ